MKHKAYRQNPTVFDVLKKARPPPGKITPMSMNCLIIILRFLMPFCLFTFFCVWAFFAPCSFQKKLIQKRNKTPSSMRIVCERGRLIA